MAAGDRPPAARSLPTRSPTMRDSDGCSGWCSRITYYTEDDVYAAARVFTGWNLKLPVEISDFECQT